MFDNPIFFLILISLISAISEWIGKRRKARQRLEQEASMEVEAGEESPHDIEAEQADRRRQLEDQRAVWEERLRRMLQGEAETESAQAEVPPDRETEFQATTTPLERPDSLPPTQTSGSVPDRPSAPLVPGAAMQVTRLQQSRKRTFINLGSKNAVREAIVASVVLGPPKALEGESEGISL